MLWWVSPDVGPEKCLYKHVQVCHFVVRFGDLVFGLAFCMVWVVFLRRAWWGLNSQPNPTWERPSFVKLHLFWVVGCQLSFSIEFSIPDSFLFFSYFSFLTSLFSYLLLLDPFCFFCWDFFGGACVFVFGQAGDSISTPKPSP